MHRFRIGRRALLRGLGGLGGIAALQRTMPALAAGEMVGGEEIRTVDADEKGAVLNIFAYEGYDSPNVLDPFAKKYGAQVKFQLVSGDADAFNKIRSGQANVFDLVNLNNPWANIFYDAGYLRPLDPATFKPYYDAMIPRFRWPYKWAHSAHDGNLLGMVQRFGPMSFVVNTKKISKATARSEGANIALEASMKGRYGVLDFPYETIYMFCVMAGVNPYVQKTPEQIERCAEVTRQTISNAKLVGSPATLNNALLNGEIDMYVAGGTFTVSSLRRDGFPEFLSVSPEKGPISGRGGTAYVEITSVVNNPNLSPLAGDFLNYMQSPEGALAVCRSGTSLNPVANIDKIVDKLSKEELMAIQYDDLEEHMELCAEFEPNPDYDTIVKVWEEALQARG